MKKFNVLILICALWSLVSSQNREMKCKTDSGEAQRCMPVFENIAYGRNIEANNTCGLNGAQVYCRQPYKICEVCSNLDPGNRHPAELMTDTDFGQTPTWWQSETLLDSNKPVYLTLNLYKTYNVFFIRLKFYSIRPHSFAIYKKSTYNPNEEWLPYQFYSSSCEETYDVPINERVQQSNQKIALCTDRSSGMIPLSGGNVAFSTLDFRPGKFDFDNSPALQDWVTVTALRFNLDRVNTFGDEVFGDPKVLRSYYFAISDINVGGTYCYYLLTVFSFCINNNTDTLGCKEMVSNFNSNFFRNYTFKFFQILTGGFYY